MSTTTTPEIEQLRDRVKSAQAQAAEHERQAEECHKEARRLRVQIAKLEAEVAAAREDRPPPVVTVAPSPESKLRDYAMHADTFTEDEAADHTGLPKARVRSLLDAAHGKGQVARIKRGHRWIYAWVKPDHDASAPERRPERAPVMVPRKRGNSVAGTGRNKKVSATREVRELARTAERAGAEVERMGNDHVRIKNEQGVITMSSTPRKKGMSRTKSQMKNRLGIKAA